MSIPSCGLVVVAAGTGQRLGAPVHKALVELDGRPLVEHTLRRLLGRPDLSPVVLVGHADDRPRLERLLATLPRPVTLVDGGARRQDSVRAGLEALGDPAPDLVLVHDGARPFVPLERLDDLVAAARRTGAALLASPVSDTLKEVPDPDGRVRRTVPRAHLWAAQTPQAFDRARLLELLERADAEGTTVTDEAGLCEAAGLAVTVVEGSRRNLKVTTPEDLELARALLRLSSADDPS